MKNILPKLLILVPFWMHEKAVDLCAIAHPTHADRLNAMFDEGKDIMRVLATTP